MLPFRPDPTKRSRALPHGGFGRAAVLGMLACVHVEALAEVSLPSIFSEHAVVQRSDATAVWGNADAGEAVEVELAGIRRATRADDMGRWRVALDLNAAPEGPHVLAVRGTNTLTVSDVLIGDVWLCSGQSNMAWRLHEADSAAVEIARAADPRLRQFITVKQPSPRPADQMDGRWIVAAGKDRGLFTAVGYHFAAALRSELGLSIGLLDISVGATPIEPWMSTEAFESDPRLRGVRDNVLERVAAYPGLLADYLEKLRDWTAIHGRADVVTTRIKSFTHPRANTEDWRRVALPGRLAGLDATLPDAGTVWLRKTVNVRPEMADHYLVLQLGRIEGFYSVFWNGELIAETNPERGAPAVARHRIDKVRAGEGVLAIRIHNPVGGLALGSPTHPFLAGDIPLAGEWLVAVEHVLPPLDADARAAYPKAPPLPPAVNDRPSGFFNGNLYPITSYKIRGFLWYQGESNTGRAEWYARAFPALIGDWRAKWGEPALPFYFCQLAGYGPPVGEPGESAWAELREAQEAALALPHTARAVLVDLGESADIHPRNKREVGERLARLALTGTYGRVIPASGPVFRDAEFGAGEVRVWFDHLEGGLVARPVAGAYRPRSTAAAEAPLPRTNPGSELEGFALRAADGPWRWADARIDGDSVVVSSPFVNRPVVVRYAWADFPRGNLYNQAGLPAAPFRAASP